MIEVLYFLNALNVLKMPQIMLSFCFRTFLSTSFPFFFFSLYFLQGWGGSELFMIFSTTLLLLLAQM